MNTLNEFQAELNQAKANGTLKEMLLGAAGDQNRLYKEVEGRNPEFVQAILDTAEADDLNVLLLNKGMGGDTALNKALSDGDKEIIIAIFKKLFVASNLPILKEALLVNNDYDVSPLHSLVLVSDKILQEVLVLARGNNALEALLMPKAGESTALHFAVYEEKIGIIAKILEESGKVAGLQKSVLLAKNSDSVTPLYIAIETDKVEVVEAAMASTDVDVLKEMFSYKSRTGDTVLHAANNRDVKEVKKAMYEKVLSHKDLLGTLTILDDYDVSALRNLAVTKKGLVEEILQTAKTNNLLKDLLALEVDGANLLAMARDEAAAGTEGAAEIVNLIEDKIRPVAVGGSFNTGEGKVLELDFGALGVTDAGTDLDKVTISLPSDKTTNNGTVKFENGKVILTPGNPGINIFNFTASYGGLNSTVATVEVKVNASPVAKDTSLTAVQNKAQEFKVTDFSVTDAETDPINIELPKGTTTKGGKVELVNGKVVYTPPVDFHGEDSFPFTATDPFSRSKEVTATVKVNASPVAKDTSLTAVQNKAQEFKVTDFSVTDADTDPIKIELPQDKTTKGGKVELVNGTVVYTPPVGFSGEDSFPFIATDNHFSSSKEVIATVNVKAACAPIIGDPKAFAFKVSQAVEYRYYAEKAKKVEKGIAADKLAKATGPTAKYSDTVSKKVNEDTLKALLKKGEFTFVDGADPSQNLCGKAELGGYCSYTVKTKDRLSEVKINKYLGNVENAEHIVMKKSVCELKKTYSNECIKEYVKDFCSDASLVSGTNAEDADRGICGADYSFIDHIVC